MDKYIYLVLSRTGTLLSRAIIHAGHMEYAHASISLDASLDVMYSFGRIYPRIPFWGGFVEEDIHGGVYTMFDDSECMVLKIPVTEMQYDRIKTELEYFKKEKKHLRYNFIGLIGVKIGIPIQREKAYFCSQFVSSVLQKTGLIGEDRNPALMTPNDLRTLADTCVIYQGLTSNYHQSA